MNYLLIKNKIFQCDSCINCNCADWEQDLKIDIQEKREECNELKQKEVVLTEKKHNCRCFQSSSNSDSSLQSLEINNIYKLVNKIYLQEKKEIIQL